MTSTQKPEQQSINFLDKTTYFVSDCHKNYKYTTHTDKSESEGEITAKNTGKKKKG